MPQGDRVPDRRYPPAAGCALVLGAMAAAVVLVVVAGAVLRACR